MRRLEGRVGIVAGGASGALDLDQRHLTSDRPNPLDRFFDRAHGLDMVVLQHDPVIEPHAMVPAASATDSVLL